MRKRQPVKGNTSTLLRISLTEVKICSKTHNLYFNCIKMKIYFNTIQGRGGGGSWQSSDFFLIILIVGVESILGPLGLSTEHPI
jgi:hypothetical protein